MEKSILTEEQFDYYIRNLDEARKNEKVTRDLITLNSNNEISLNSSSATSTFSEMLGILKSNGERINNNLMPFEERNNIYQSRKNEIISKHGYSSTDMYDEATMNDIVELQKSMRKESENLSTDLKNVIVNERANELNKMLDVETNKNTNQLAARFK